MATAMLGKRRHEISIDIATPIKRRRTLGNKSESLENVNLVLNAHWPEKGWLNEADIIREARRKLNTSEDKDLVRHLHSLLASHDVTGSDTDIVLAKLGLIQPPPNQPPPPKAVKSRVLRLFISPKLVPLFEHSGEHLLTAWMDCLKCHFSLWNKGIEHADINAWNLMWDEDNKCGVINEWDRACIRDGIMKNGKKETGVICERTGSILFMARDLLIQEFKVPGVEPLRRLYRHEVESFVWVATFVCMIKWIENVPSPQPGSIEDMLSKEIMEWRTESPTVVRRKKNSFLLTARNFTIAHPTCDDAWKKTLLLLELLFILDYALEPGEEPSSVRLYEAVINIVEGKITQRMDVRKVKLT